MDDGASPAALRGTALQAIASLQAVVDQVTGELQRLTRMVDATASPEVLVADPDNPVQMQRTLTIARTELAAAREALAPFAHAWSRKMELIADTEVDVFVDPLRPDKTRRIVLRDLARASKVYKSMTVGIELLDRLYHAEGLLQKLIELHEWHVDKMLERRGEYGEFAHRLANLANEYSQHLDRHAHAPAVELSDDRDEP